MQHINVRLEKRLLRTLARIDSHRVASENASYFHTITSFADVHQFIVHAERNGVWCLTVRDIVRGFLQFNNLLIGKSTSIVDDLHRVSCIAGLARANSGLCNLAPVNVDLDSVIADLAPEKCYGNEVRYYWLCLCICTKYSPSFISGMMGVVRITNPLMLTSLSMSNKFG